jgi:glycosyltransferase involved in cell wall biosynthesis
VPVIGTDAGGTPELIASGRTGLLYPPRDAGALAADCLTAAKIADDAIAAEHLGRLHLCSLCNQVDV